ncbi:PREDICTED: uncharacterized protein LOC104597557 [Nelumbo nucifera]|uniref:Uncharacterized protein LOC104597557 n=2 Tax=Nelumbo nucifera TaxID=4432 RepID=A0A1U7ZYR0_NELNU|nr:PREDICTED: uncharacterized protein LOC104597557 [Nelumbo nucifera]DAD42201.1 TPA_asm: hypothetical protein HUJ06_000431 [Nelumbo nucifera]
MATLASSLPTTFARGFQRLNTRSEIPAITVSKVSAKIPLNSSSFRFVNAVNVRLRQRLPLVLASSTNPSGGDSSKEQTKGTETAGSEGPPFLTILAGLVVFLFICWILGSIIMWLIGLIVNVSSK